MGICLAGMSACDDESKCEYHRHAQYATQFRKLGAVRDRAVAAWRWLGYLLLSLESFITLVLGGRASVPDPPVRLVAEVEGVMRPFLIVLFVSSSVAGLLAEHNLAIW